MNHSLSEFTAGARDTAPLVLAAIPFGMLYGALAAAGDLSVWTTMAMSLFVFAGSSQFVAVNMILAATPVIMIVVATFFVNLRHLMYSANLLPHTKNLPMKTRVAMAFWLTDETFAAVSNKIATPHSQEILPPYYFGSALFMYSNWQLCSLLGFYLGQSLDDPLSWGLDIAMVVAFIGVIAPRLNSRPMWICALTAFFCACLTNDWPYNSGLIFSMLCAIATGLLSSRIKVGRYV